MFHAEAIVHDDLAGSWTSGAANGEDIAARPITSDKVFGF